MVLTLTMVSATEIDALQDVYDENEEKISQVIQVDETITEDNILEAQKQAVIKTLPAIKEQELPSIISTLFANERLNIDLGDGYKVLAVIEDGEITRLEEGELRYATVNVKVSDKVFDDIGSNIFSLEDSVKNKDITYQGVGIIRKAKFSFYGTALKFASFF